MRSNVISGKEIADRINAKLKREISGLKSAPGLAVILVGDNPASKIYVSIKRKQCQEMGIYSEEHKLPETATEEELFRLIDDLNVNEKINAILIQLPVPKHIDTLKMFGKVSLEKDVDGFNAFNLGRLVEGNEQSVPCTPKGIIRILEETGIDVRCKHAVIVGRSSIVGKPVAAMLLNRDSTVTICHSKTKNLADITKQADILVVAAGKPRMIKEDMVKENAVVVDVGINKVDGKIVGDVDFENVKNKAKAITPVPGGVGPMTVAMLLENTLNSFKLQNRK